MTSACTSVFAQEAAPAATPSSTPAAAPAQGTAPTAAELAAIRAELERLRAVVEQQQAQLAKINATPAPAAAPAPAPAPEPVPAPAPEEEASSLLSRVQINGFGNWAFGHTDSIASYSLATPTGEYENVDTGLTISANVAKNVRAVMQVDFSGKGGKYETEVDLAFVDWRVNDRFSVRMGKVKMPYGNYTEVWDQGTRRPFMDLPQNTYGLTGLLSKSLSGVSVNGSLYSHKKWDVQYDLYFGGTQFSILDHIDGLPEAFPTNVKQTFGGRLLVGVPVNGLHVGVNGYTGIGDVNLGMGQRYSGAGALVNYETDKILVNSEFNYQDLWGGWLQHRTAYVEGGYKITKHVQPVFRYDWLRLTATGGVPADLDRLIRNREIAAGINYWFSPKVVLKASYHNINGNRLAVDYNNYTPYGIYADIYGFPYTMLAPPLPETTQSFVTGISFVF